MTTNRDKDYDRRETMHVMGLFHPDIPNWLGHTGGGCVIDYALLYGATIEQLSLYRDAVDEHIRHLQIEHGLTIVSENGVYRFSEDHLDAPA